jgi:hypothetical protein
MGPGFQDAKLIENAKSRAISKLVVKATFQANGWNQ